MNRRQRLTYAGTNNGLLVVEATEWKRGDIPEMKMSTSSGPKDYTANMMCLVFEKRPEIDAIKMVVGNGTPFCVFQVKGHWFDCTGKQVVFSG